MKQSTVLRIVGAFVLVLMLIVIGTFHFQNPLVLVAVFGFAYVWEKFVVKPTIKTDKAKSE